MIWSVSASKAFKRCQRQWYFKNCFASAKSSDPLRRKAYLLGKLQSISAWRGQIVDVVISQTIVPALNRRSRISLAYVKNRAQTLFESQLTFARQHPLHQPGLRPSALGTEFAALHCMEYQGTISEEDVAAARSEIEQALTNLFGMRDIASELKSALYVVAQRALIFTHSGVTVRGVPDAIAFYEDRPPLIVDWKVHTFGIQDASLQLGVYALALKRCSPHRDFPQGLAKWHPTDLPLVEVQLLTSQLRRYQLSDDQNDEIDEQIARSVEQMILAIAGRDNSDLRPDDFPAAYSPAICQRCPYRSICWEVAA